MAGIEKICEYSGDYHGWLMHGWKRDHIQVCPEYRKLFRGKDSILFWNPEPHGYREDYLAYAKYLYVFPDWILFSAKLPKCLHWIRRYNSIRVPRFWRPMYWRWRMAGQPPVNPAVPEYEYCLWCPDLPGRVEGKYYERTTNPLRTWKNLYKLVYPADQVYDHRVFAHKGETWCDAVDRRIKELETEEETE